jgi:deferrochelatase/peroxidase EfeB
MRREIKVRTGQMLDTSDLTVSARIRQGLVPSLDAVSYKTRAERVLQLLQLGRSGQYEFELTRVLADSVERIGMIHSVRVGIIEPQNLLMLSVTFDGAWEPYMRVIWQKVARLLDLIFCNTEGYAFGWESSYEDWMIWLRRHQVSSPFFFSQAQMSAGDVDLLRRQEWLQRQHSGQESEARLLQGSNADVVEAALSDGRQSDPRFPGSEGYRATFGGNFLLVRQSVRALAALHRLTDVYLPGTHDGWVLHRAACEALARLAFSYRSGSIPGSDSLDRFTDALEWLKVIEPDPPPARQPPLLQAALTDVLPEALWPQVQAGILEPLDADHGGVLLLRFESAPAMGAFLQKIPLSHHAKPFNDEGISVNIALAVEGLRLAGFTDDELRTWPDAFYEGMPRRAGLLGDVRVNHPRNWHLPARLVGGTLAANEVDDEAGVTRVELAEMHVLLHVRLRRGAATTPKAATAILRDFLLTWTAPKHRLAIQWLHRQKNGLGQTKDHFGWRDAQTGPVFDISKSSPRARDHTHIGEALCGHANAVDYCWPAASQPCAPWLHNGSFLVVRKLRQDVLALNEGVAGVKPPLDPDLVRAKLMGRWHDDAKGSNAGLPLVKPPPPTNSNDFNFAADENGAICPLHAHIRRANQRMSPGSLTNDRPVKVAQGPVRPPKLLRRSMSYGPTFAKGAERADRGLFFMAYNASLVEQFEVIQRWLSGGNSSGSDSAQADPLLGVATPGQTRTSLFHHDGQVHRVALEPAVPLNEEPRALVRLEWGAYWFAPSLPVVAEIAGRALAAREAPLWSAHRGEEEIKRLLALERREGQDVSLLAWKEALEDPESLIDYRAASIWAAIRDFHGGHLKCAFGVLIGDPEGVDRVLRKEEFYSASGYQARMQYSFGPIFLGSDASTGDGRYERESAFIVEEIRRLPVEETYERARKRTRERLHHLRSVTIEAAREAGDEQWRLTFDVRELLDDLLGYFCQTWFGIRSGDGQPFEWGGLDVMLNEHDKPRNPGHFASPSRYFFQPHPTADVARVGQAHGRALRRAMQALLDARDPATEGAPMVRAVRANPLSTSDRGYAARTLVGVVMGFVPTVDGTLRRILAEWLREGSFWRLRGLCSSLPDFVGAYRFMQEDFIRAIQMRAAPELLWRTAAVDHTLGNGAHAISVRAGDRVVAGLMSATQCRWQQGGAEYHHVFGGDRDAAGPPTHACPGTHAAMALMVGFFAALLETDLPLRPGPTGLSFETSGVLERQQFVDVEVSENLETLNDAPKQESLKRGQKNRGRQEGLKGSTAAESALLTETPSLSGAMSFTTEVSMMALGDSWLTYGLLPSLSGAMGKRGYRFDRDHRLAVSQWTLTAIADSASDAGPMLPDVDMVVLDGGGNDVHQKPSRFPDPQNPDWSLPHSAPRSTLDDLLKGKGRQVILNPDTVWDFINVYLRAEMRRALTTLTTASTPRPVVIVAYDYPIPNGKVRVGKPWLEPAFTRVGLDATVAADLAVSTGLMRELITTLNEMIADLVKSEFPGKNVFAVKLTGILNAEEWIDELHPKSAGFDKLALALDTKIRKLPVPHPVP